MTESVPEELVQFRKEIDVLDEQLIDLLARRYQIVSAVAELKARENIAVVQPARAEAVKQRAVDMGAAKGLDEGLVRKIYDAMIDYAHEREYKIVDDTQAAGEQG